MGKFSSGPQLGDQFMAMEEVVTEYLCGCRLSEEIGADQERVG